MKGVADGAGEWVVAIHESGTRLDKFIAAPGRLGSRSRAATALERRKVFLNDVEVGFTQGGTRVKAGDRVRVWLDRPGSSRAPRSTTGDLAIVYEDQTLIVINKPSGLLTVPLDRQPAASSVRDQLREYLRPMRRLPHVVHRIDRDTSGLVLFAKSEKVQAELKGQFRRREPERVYWAFVYGCPAQASGVWRDHLVWDERALVQKETHPGDPRGTAAESRYRVVERFSQTSWIEVSLVTGKRNQIRLQARLRGHTLVGEQRYVFGPDDLRPIAFPRQALHARRLSFRHPDDGRPVSFEADLPKDMADLLGRLRQHL